MSYFLLFILSLNLAFAVEASSLEYLNKITSEALELLPAEVKQYKFKLKLKKFKGKIAGNICSNDEKKIYGQVRNILGKKTLIINEELVELARKNKNTFPCLHGSYEKQLKATLIHELLHFYDHKNKISKRRSFLALIGGKHKLALRKKLYNSSTRTVDPYEYINSAEAFAVNAEYFYLDKNFACLKPAYYNFFKKTLGHDPAKGIDCSTHRSILLSENENLLNLSRSKELDFSRLYAIHYLYADKAKAIMSRWGHSMFRLVLCAPERKEVSERCLDDISHHLVVSYRANVSDASISYLAGLMGKYPSQLFIYELSSVLQEYNGKELRDLWSIPLDLNLEERKSFLDLTLQKFWDYKGKYFFFLNNCASESGRHLESALGKKVKSFTPRKIFKNLVKEKQFDLDKREEHIKNGLLFESRNIELKKALRELQKWGIYTDKSLEDVLEIETIERLKLYKELVARQDFLEKPEFEQMALSFYIKRLEKYVRSLQVDELSEKVVKKALSNKDTRLAIEKEVSKNELLVVDQWKILSESTDLSAYGVPASEKVLLALKQANTKRRELGALDILTYISDSSFVDTIEREFKDIQEMLVFLRPRVLKNLQNK